MKNVTSNRLPGVLYLNESDTTLYLVICSKGTVYTSGFKMSEEIHAGSFGTVISIEAGQVYSVESNEITLWLETRCYDSATESARRIAFGELPVFMNNGEWKELLN